MMLKGLTRAPTVADIALLSGFNQFGRFRRSCRDRLGDLSSRSRDLRR